MEPDTFNNLLLHLLSLCSKGKLSPPPFLNHPPLRVGGGAEIWKGLLGEEEEEEREEGDCRVVSVNKRSLWQRSTDSPWLLSPLLLVCWQRMD